MAASIQNFLSKFSSKSKDEEDRFIKSTSVTLREDRHSSDPNKAWNCRKKSQSFKTLTPIDVNTPPKKGCVRFVCISDSHTVLEKQGKDGLSIPDGDVLLHAGDFTMYGTPDEVALVNEYLGTLPHKYKIVIAGNHDVAYDLDLIDRIRSTRVWKLNKDNYERRLNHYGVKTVHEMLSNCIYLQDSMVKVYGINIYGSPWQPGGGNWGFNCHRGLNLLEKWNRIPENTDILLTHGPPCGNGDNVNRSILKKVFDPRGPTSPHHVGCVDLLNTIQNRVKPKYHLFGHIHEGYGMTSDGTTTFINASVCDEHYRARNAPIVFDFPLHKRSKTSVTSEKEFEWIIPTVLPNTDTSSESDDTENSDSDDYCSAESDDDILFREKENDTKRKNKTKENQKDDDETIVFSDEKCDEITCKTNLNLDQGNDNDDDIVFSDEKCDEITCKTSMSLHQGNDNGDSILFSNEKCDEIDDSFIVFSDEITSKTNLTSHQGNDVDDDSIVFSDQECDEIDDGFIVYSDKITSKTNLTSHQGNDVDFIVFSDEKCDEVTSKTSLNLHQGNDDDDNFIVFSEAKCEEITCNTTNLNLE